jgi:hypothetical protein
MFPYQYAKNLFETKILGSTYTANLPEKSVSTSITSSTSGATESNSEEDNAGSPNAVVTAIPEIVEWQDAIKAMVLKSFIYDNTAITFKVPGNLYREAGFFIQVKVEQNQEVKNKTQDISGYYFVISLRHIFSGENYLNEIVAVKLNKNEKLNTNTTSGLINNLISGISKTSEATNTTSVTTTSDVTSNPINSTGTATSTTAGVIDTSAVMETETIPNTEPKTEDEIQKEVEQYGLLPPI